MKIENWHGIRPFLFYLKPLDDAITEVRKTLLDMNEKGPLRRRYVIELNKVLAALTYVSQSCTF